MKTSSTLFSMAVLGLLSHTTATKTAFNANFDKLVVVPEESRLNPVGIYENISFTGFDVNQPGVANISFNGVIPESEPNQAALASDPANMTVVYAGSEEESLALSSFFYGCGSQLKQGVVDIAVACTFTVTGYRTGSSSPVVSQTFTFTPAQPVDLQNAPTFGTFSNGFTNLQTVEFVVEPSATAIGLVDNIVGTLTS